MRGFRRGLGHQQVAGDVAGGDVGVAGGGDEDVGVVLADAVAGGEGLGGGGGGVGDAGLVGDAVADAGHEAVQPGDGAVGRLGEGGDGGVGGGERGVAEEDAQRHRLLEAGDDAGVVGDVDGAAGGDLDGAVGAGDGQEVQPVAEAVADPSGGRGLRWRQSSGCWPSNAGGLRRRLWME